MTKDEIAEVIATLTPEEMSTALNFLTGNDPRAVEDALRYAQRAAQRERAMVREDYVARPRERSMYGIRPHLDLSPEDLATQKRMAEEFLQHPWPLPNRELGPE
jgi:hypothetical protein